MTAKSPADSPLTTTEPVSRLSIGQCATLACLIEATSPKPGNVHRGCDFEDMTFLDFAVSATAIGPVVESAAEQGVGATVLRSIQATRRWVPVNTNLGSVLLIAPLACVPRDRSLTAGLDEVLANLDADDARQVYEAIRLAQPGGLGRADRLDVAGPPPTDLLAAMRLAADRDLVARQYVSDFQQVLQFAVPSLVEGVQGGWRLTDAVVHTQMRLMSEYPDSLIARKCGDDVARRSADFASRVLAAGGPGEDSYQQALADLDFWLRCDGNRRNPGTTADLLAAALFAILRDGRIRPPFA
ncbi:MAG: triphosphoribosyl-dephospho-CoA synthase [Pirellulaceae bacterium]|nr:triphosphoribosyl-dephospho-CoA synthase [Pirellulaceae bacterium]